MRMRLRVSLTGLNGRFDRTRGPDSGASGVDRFVDRVAG
jgi:hypothetical protein